MDSQAALQRVCGPAHQPLQHGLGDWRRRQAQPAPAAGEASHGKHEGAVMDRVVDWVGVGGLGSVGRWVGGSVGRWVGRSVGRYIYIYIYSRTNRREVELLRALPPYGWYENTYIYIYIRVYIYIYVYILVPTVGR